MITPCKQVMDTGRVMFLKVLGSRMQEGVGEAGTPSKYNPTASIPSMQRNPSKTKVTCDVKKNMIFRSFTDKICVFEDLGSIKKTMQTKVSPEPFLLFLSVAPSQSLQRRQHRAGFQLQDPKRGFIVLSTFSLKKFLPEAL